MRVLVIGSGAREHAICWKLRQSPKLAQLFCAPGNPGISKFAETVGFKVDQIEKLADFAKANAIDLTVVGPEYPLSLGIVDAFHSQGLRIFGPSKAAARLESSKAFAKEVMLAAGVPTANYNSFNNPQAALDYLRTVSPTAASPQVLKADGLASGKGVFICEDFPQAEQALKEIFTDLKGGQVVIEEFLKGQEVSFIVATDGERIVPLAPSHDYKRIFENDRGPNTGGMGTVSPSPRLSGDMEKGLSELVIEPVLREMRRRGMPFQGFLYAGLMIGYGGEVNVLEYNARLGDPECQVIMRRMESDLLEILLNLSSSGEQLPEVKWTPEHAVCVVLAAHGYPASPRAGDEINGIELAEQLSDCVVFHAGTKIDRQRLVTAGGRVMSVTATGPNIESARNKAYRAASLIQFAGCQLRRDIGLS